MQLLPILYKLCKKKVVHREKNGLLLCKQDMVLNYSIVTTLLRTAEENLLLVAPSAFTTR